MYIQCSNRWAFMDRTLKEKNASRATTKCGNDWVAVAALVPGRTNVQCCRRWPNVNPTMADTERKKRRFLERSRAVNVAADSPIDRVSDTPRDNVTRAFWTSGEDAQLCAAVTKWGEDWVEVASLVPGRTNV
jgi:hypothetical protein